MQKPPARLVLYVSGIWFLVWISFIALIAMAYLLEVEIRNFAAVGYALAGPFIGVPIVALLFTKRQIRKALANTLCAAGLFALPSVFLLFVLANNNPVLLELLAPAFFLAILLVYGGFPSSLVIYHYIEKEDKAEQAKWHALAAD